MKVYVVEYRCYGDCELIGLFTSAAVAEKYIEQDIKTCFGLKADIGKDVGRSRYYISIEDVIGE